MGRGFKVVAFVAVSGFLVCSLLLAAMSAKAKSFKDPKNLLNAPRHPVTDPMWRRAKAVAGKLAPNFTLTDSESHEVTLQTECKTGPVVLVFTKDGCPCSMEAQPFFNQLANGFRGKVTFLGIIDGPKHVASKYHDDFKVPYRMLLAEDGAVFKTFDAQQSVYTTLIAADGTVMKQWPGYNKAMLIELDSMLADATKSEPIKLELSMAPDEISSGCIFETPKR